MPMEEHLEIEALTQAEEDKRNGPKQKPEWKTYEKYLSGVTMDSGERPLIPTNPLYRDDEKHMPYHTFLTEREADMKFADQFEDIPQFIEFSDYMSKYPAVEAGLKHVTKYYEDNGHLRYAHLVGDNFVHVNRSGDSNQIIECSARVQEDNDVAKVVTYGQHNKNGDLHGLGRKIRVWSRCACDIWEGNFKDGLMDDFGRWITVYWSSKDVPDDWDGKFASYTGYWLENEVHGYGRMIHTEGNVDEGFFEKTHFRANPENIESYDYEDSRILFKAGYIKESTRARKLDFTELIEIPEKQEVDDRTDFH